MAQSKKTVFEIFMEGLGIYLKHFLTFFKYMSFPIFGQIVGIILSFALSLGFAYKIGVNMNDTSLSFAITMLLAIPGLILFTKAFWEYLIAYVSICSMTENTLKSGRIYDINAHKKVATMSKRVGVFITLWLLFWLYSIIAIMPPMWIVAAVIFVFISLIFQVFTFEKNISAIDCFKRSFNLVKTDFIGTLGILIVVGITTYFILPKIIEFVFGLMQIIALLTVFVEPIITNTFPINQWNAAIETLGFAYMISSLEIAKMIISSAISGLVIAFTLPLRSICFTLWYKQLSIKEIKNKEKKKKAKSENV